MKIKYLCCQTEFGPLIQNAAVKQRNNYALCMNKNNYENEYLHLSKLEFKKKKKFPAGDQGVVVGRGKQKKWCQNVS